MLDASRPRQGSPHGAHSVTTQRGRGGLRGAPPQVPADGGTWAQCRAGQPCPWDRAGSGCLNGDRLCWAPGGLRSECPVPNPETVLETTTSVCPPSSGKSRMKRWRRVAGRGGGPRAAALGTAGACGACPAQGWLVAAEPGLGAWARGGGPAWAVAGALAPPPGPPAQGPARTAHVAVVPPAPLPPPARQCSALSGPRRGGRAHPLPVTEPGPSSAAPHARSPPAWYLFPAPGAGSAPLLLAGPFLRGSLLVPALSVGGASSRCGPPAPLLSRPRSTL